MNTLKANLTRMSSSNSGLSQLACFLAVFLNRLWRQTTCRSGLKQHLVVIIFLSSVFAMSEAGAVSLNKAIVPSVNVNPGAVTQLQITVFNDAVSGVTNIPLTNTAFFDDLAAFTDQPNMKIANPANVVNNCPGATITAVPGTQLLSVTGMTVPAKVGATNGRCDVYVDITTTTQGNTVDTIPIGNLTNNEGYTNAQAASATLTVNTVLAPSLTMSLSSTTIYLGGTTKLSINLTNNANMALTNNAWTNTLPVGIQLSNTPNVTTSAGCTGGTAVSAPANGTSIALSNATIAIGATCTVTVDITGNTQGNYNNIMLAGAVTNNQGVTNASPASQIIGVQSFNALKSFGTNPVKTNQVSTMTVSIISPQTYTSLAFTDDFSSQTGLVIATPANASTTCGPGVVTATPGTQFLSLSNGTITGNGNFVSPASCIVRVDVIVPSNLNTGIKTNTMLAGSITGLAGAIPASNINDVIASLTVNPYVVPTMTKAFATDPIFVGQNSSMTVSVRNNDTVPFTLVGWTDNLPPGLIANAAATKNAACSGGTVSPLVGGGSVVSLSGVTIAAGATCIVTVPVTAIQQGGPFINTIYATSFTNNQGTGIAGDVSAQIGTVNTLTASKTFASSTVAVGVPTKMTITISNQSTHGYNSLEFTDSFISGGNNIPNLRVATPANASTDCGTGVVTAVPNTQSVSLGLGGVGGGQIVGGSFGAAVTCKVEVDVVATAGFTSKANTIPIGGVTGVDASNGSTGSSYQAATANIAAQTVTIPTLGKSFSTGTAYVGQVFNLVITARNNDGTFPLTNVNFTDTMPAGLKMNGAAGFSGCGVGASLPIPGDFVSLSFTGGTIGANSTCTITIPVVATTENQTSPGFTNTLLKTNFHNSQNVTDTVDRSASVIIRSINGTKAFSQPTVHPNTPVTLTITVLNYSTDSYNNLRFTDLLSSVNANLKVAPTPNASTTCNASTVPSLTADPNTSSIILANGSIGPGTAGTPSSCTVKVDVQSAVAFASAANTIVAGDIKANAVSNGSDAKSYANATANIAVINIVNPVLSKAFAPNPVYVGQTSTLSINVQNADTLIPLTGVKWIDTLPANLTMTGAPLAGAGCGGSPSLTTSGQTINFGQTVGATIAAGATCTVTVTVVADRQSLGTNFLNTMPANSVTSNETTVSNAASDTLTVNTLDIVKTFDGAGTSPAAATVSNINSIVKLRLTIRNSSTHAYNNIAFTDNFGASGSSLPATFVIATPNNLTQSTPSCGGTVTATQGTRIISLSNGSLPAGSFGSPASCYIEVDTIGTATFTNLSNVIPSPNTSCVGAGALIATDNSGLAAQGSAACDKNGTTGRLTLGNISAPTLTKAIAPGTVFLGENATLTFTATNTDNVATLTGVGWTDNLSQVAPGIVVNGAPGYSASCGTPTIDTTATTIIVTDGTIAPLAVCTITVPVTGDRTGTFTNRIGNSNAYRIFSDQTPPSGATVNANLVVRALSAIKGFAPGTINVGQTSTLTITLRNNATVAYNNLNVTDDLSTMDGGAGVYIAPVPNASTTCNNGGLENITAVAGSQSISLSNGLIGAGSAATATTCIIKVDVIGNISGNAKTNTLLIAGVSATAPNGTTTNITANATADITVNAAVRPTIAKVFSKTPIIANGVDTSMMTITVSNSNSIGVNNIDVTDTFPALLNGLVIASSPAVTNSCNGNLVATPGTNTLHLDSGTIAANSSCQIVVPVVSTLPFASNANTVSLNSASTVAGQVIGTFPRTTTANIQATDILTATKQFGSTVPFTNTTTIALGSKTRLTVVITNNSAVVKTGVGFTDGLPSRVNVATPINLTNNCGGSITNNTTNFVLAGGTIPAYSGGAPGSCTVSLDVVGVSGGGSQNNQIVNVTSTQTSPAFASTNVAPITVTAAAIVYDQVTKAYNLTSPIPLNQTSPYLRATISWRQTVAGPSINPSVTDNLPTGLRVADTALMNVTTTCGTIASTTVNNISASRDQIIIALTHNQTAQTCSVSYNLVPTAPIPTTNVIRIGDIRSANGTATNTANSNNATMSITNVLTITKNFQPGSLGPNGVALLTINISNPEQTPLFNASLTDNLPFTLPVATNPNNLVVADWVTLGLPTPSTDCTATSIPNPSLVNAPIGGSSITLTGGVIQAAAAGVAGGCKISVWVKPPFAYASGTAINTIPIGALSAVDAFGQSRTNIAPAATDTITYVSPALGAGKSFAPVQVQGGSVSKLAVTIINPQTYVQTGIAFTDTMPVGMTIGSPPNPQTTCTGGVFSGVAVGATSWSFSGGSVQPNNASCEVSVNATMDVEGNLTNTIPAGGITTNNGASNSQKAEATLTNLAGASFGKSFSPNPILVNQATRLTINITNSSNIKDLTNMGFVDDLTLGGTQSGLTVATIPNITNTCGGSVTINPANTLITLTNGSLLHSSVCSVQLDLVALTEGSYTNRIPSSTLTNNETITNADPSEDTLDVNASIKVVKHLNLTTDAGRFNLTMSPAAPVGATSRLAVGNDADVNLVSAFAAHGGTAYTLTETGAGITSLADYMTSYDCTNANGIAVTSGSGVSVIVTPPVSAGHTPNEQAITCIFTNINRQALLTVYKNSVDGVGTFSFTGTNGLPLTATTITTATAGVSATVPALTNVVLTTKNTATDITEGVLPTGFVLSSASCTGLQGGDTANLVGNVLTIPATSIIDGARISCTFINNKLPVTIALTKALANNRPGGLADNDQFTVQIRDAAGSSVLAFGTTLGTGMTVTDGTTGIYTGVAGNNYTLTEIASGTTSLANYNASISCNNNGVPLGAPLYTGTATALNATPQAFGSVLEAGDNMVCTLTNTRKTVALSLDKTWGAGALAGNEIIVTSSIEGVDSALVNSIAPTNTTGASVNALAGDTVSLPAETFNVGSSSDYTTTVSCSGNNTGVATLTPTLGSFPYTLKINGLDTSLICTYTNIFSAVYYDYGDAPLSYGTAKHQVTGIPAVYLGNTRPDIDSSGNAAIWQGQTTAKGDDLNNTDDEGIIQLLTSLSSFPALTTTTTSYSLNLWCSGTTTANAISGWIDFNQNNVFDAGERTQGTCSSVTNGTVTLTWNSFPGITSGPTFARFRIASLPAESANETGTAANGEVEDYRLTIAAQDYTITGTVFKDTGTLGGIANNGIQDGGETGLSGVTVTLTNCSGTVYDTATTGGTGAYSLSAASAPNGAVCVEQRNLSGYTSIGANTTVGTISTADKISFTKAANTSYNGLNFGDVPPNQFTTDGAKTGVPGTTVIYPHTFNAGTTGSVTFSLPGATASPVLPGWQETLFRDLDCDGVLELTAGDSALTAAVNVVASGEVCIIVQQFIPNGAPEGASNLSPVRATFEYTGATAVTPTIPFAVADGIYNRQDVTTVNAAAVLLQKEVRNETTPTTPVWKTSNRAKTGDILEYRITYTNNSPKPISGLVIKDGTPAFTTFVSALCETDEDAVPSTLGTCRLNKSGLSSGGTGALIWNFVPKLPTVTNPQLLPGGKGSVTFKVVVD